MTSGYATITRYGAAFQAASPTRGGATEARQGLVRGPTTPVRQRLAP